jgi:hypothetical protein
VSEKTGLHPDDQKVVYKDKERDSKAFLDMAGVKDRSKMVMLEDPAAKAKRLLEERRTSKAERAAKAIARVALDVDKLATKVRVHPSVVATRSTSRPRWLMGRLVTLSGLSLDRQVSALETVASKGGKVVDADVATLTEALMRELVELDSIAADGDAKAQRRAQERRVQRHVETLDAIRAKNKAAAPSSNRTRRPAHLPPRPQNQQRRQFQPPAPTTATAPAPQTQTAASWDSFDLLSSVPPSTSAAAAPVTSTTTPSPRLDWELF